MRGSWEEIWISNKIRSVDRKWDYQFKLHRGIKLTISKYLLGNKNERARDPSDCLSHWSVSSHLHVQHDLPTFDLHGIVIARGKLANFLLAKIIKTYILEWSCYIFSEVFNYTNIEIIEDTCMHWEYSNYWTSQSSNLNCLP